MNAFSSLRLVKPRLPPRTKLFFHHFLDGGIIHKLVKENRMDMGKRGKTGFENGNQNGGHRRIAAAVDMSREMFVCWGKYKSVKDHLVAQLSDKLFRRSRTHLFIVARAASLGLHCTCGEKKPLGIKRHKSTFSYFLYCFVRILSSDMAKCYFRQASEGGKRRPASRRNGGARAY